MHNIRPSQIGQYIRRALRLHFIPVVLVAAPSAMANTDQETQQLETLVVTASALKVETPAQETPKALSIVTQEDIVARAPQKLDEALRYTSGVTAQPYGADNDTDWLKVRGFDAATYQDGSRLFRDGYYTWLVEPYALERIEVLKGPASILYGEAPPGGVVNAVQKKPTDIPQGEVGLQVGNDALRTLTLDISDYANQDGSVRYRLVALMKENDGQLNGTQTSRNYLAPSLSIDISEQTRLTLLASFLEDSGVPTNPFFPAAGTLIDSNFGHIDPSTNLGQPDYDKYERRQVSLGYLFEHDLNDVWALSQTFNYGDNDLYLRSSYAFSNDDPSKDTLTQGIVFRDGSTESLSLDNKAVAKWDSARVENTLLMGLELQRHQTQGVELDNYSFGTINPFNPIYGNYTPIDESSAADRTITKEQASLYAQYQIKLDQQWIGLIGGRMDWVDTENESQKNAQRKSRSDAEFSFNAGLMYLASNGVSPYLSYSQSFDVLSTIDSATGELYKPLKGEQTEVGVKYQPEFYDGYINLAWFDITQQNALVTNPTTFVATQTGEMTAQGIEVESVGYVTDSLKLTASYTFTNAKTDETGGKGTQQAGLIPKHQASAWLDYDAAQLGLQGWTFGSGVRYIGESKDNPRSSDRTVPSVTLVDLMAGYEITENWQAQLNINNLFDREFVSGCDYWCYYGQSRSAVLSANYRW
ncbi:TonB-dependent siderophore receptor FhuA [Vibrio cholerae]|uniref:TonB-dependent siderophore receptor FhuA n=1 Tax=Vibrio cholerae TaxID=666 RepID=UPI0008938BAE|nr:TonB-dependent siderophore receptor FhuA [Vibrio cholerae]OFJ35975.1 ligand-gated channel [Vibrio cholerae]